ncbi:MAG: glycosyltransferase [Verrucomicrobiota bacterium]
MNKLMRVHHIIASINLEIGGPAVSTTQLNRHLQTNGIQSEIHSIDYTRHGPLADPQAGPFVEAGWFTERSRGWNTSFQAQTRQAIQSSPGIIHNHGCWMAPNLLARKLAHSLHLPFLISPRGMLEPWSMDFHSYKKKLAWKLYEQSNLSAANAFHATSDAEVESIRQLGFRQPIYRIPNGVNVSPAPAKRPESLQQIISPFFLFLSRIHPKKGIDLLLRSWDSIKKDFPEWKLVIAGPDLDKYRETLDAQFPSNDQIIWTGAVSGETKDWLLHHAAFLSLPTHSENFGIVIAEALAHQTPVLTTDQTPWTAIVDRDCGWVIAPEQAALTSTLKQALTTPSEQLKKMGQQGSDWMKAEFTWDTIADRMRQAYQHLSESGPAPDFAITE